MKNTSSANRFNSNSRLLLGFLGLLLSGCVLLASLGAMSKTFAARIGSPHAGPSASLALSSKNDVASSPGPAHRLDEQGNRPAGMYSCRCTREALVRSGLLEMEIGSRWDRRAAMYSMLQPRPWMPTLCWLASRQVAASAARFIARLTLGIHGPRWCL